VTGVNGEVGKGVYLGVCSFLNFGIVNSIHYIIIVYLEIYYLNDVAVYVIRYK
jgi:hypothetical protein